MHDPAAVDALRTWLEARGAQGAWSDEDGLQPPVEVHGEVSRAVSGVLAWIASSEEAMPESLFEAFRDVALAYRYHGFTVMDTLAHVSEIEEALADGDLAEGDPVRQSRLRRAVWGLVEEVVRLNRRLDRRHHREQYDALEAFSEILTHELGNRLGAARTGVEILTALPAEAAARRREALTGLISESIDAALETVDDVTRLMSTQAHPADHDAARLTDVAHGVARSVRPVARRMGVRLEVEDGMPDVLVDGSRMRLVLSNLLLNGARYADADEEERFVHMSAEVDGDLLRVEVRDNGVGIEEEERQRVFRPHQRGRLAEDQGKGSGLGLAIVREAVAQMRGGIELESEPGVGSVFTITVPIRGNGNDTRR